MTDKEKALIQAQTIKIALRALNRDLITANLDARDVLIAFSAMNKLIEKLENEDTVTP